MYNIHRRLIIYRNQNIHLGLKNVSSQNEIKLNKS